MKIKRVYSGAPWEKKVGYCRAIRAGNQIFVTGTAPIHEDGTVACVGNGYGQAKKCLEIIDKALSDLEVDRKSIVRTRMFVTDIKLWEEFGKAHREFFSEHPPATSMVEINRLIDPAMLIEIEADAISE